MDNYFGEHTIGILKLECPLKDSSEMWNKMKFQYLTIFIFMTSQKQNGIQWNRGILVSAEYSNGL